MYKKRYFLAFYDRTGENFINCFDSVKDIAKYLKMDINDKKALNSLYVKINVSIKDNTTTDILGKPSKIYLIEI